MVNGITLPKTRMVCPTCKTEELEMTGPCKWDFNTQKWVLIMGEACHCHRCEEDIQVVEVPEVAYPT